MVAPVVLHGACSLVAQLLLAPLQQAGALSSVRSTVLALVELAAGISATSLAAPMPHSTTIPRSSSRAPLVPMRARSPSRRAPSSSSSVC